jgi:hypothetical protein
VKAGGYLLGYHGSKSVGGLVGIKVTNQQASERVRVGCDPLADAVKVLVISQLVRNEKETEWLTKRTMPDSPKTNVRPTGGPLTIQQTHRSHSRDERKRARRLSIVRLVTLCLHLGFDLRRHVIMCME